MEMFLLIQRENEMTLTRYKATLFDDDLSYPTYRTMIEEPRVVVDDDPETSVTESWSETEEANE